MKIRGQNFTITGNYLKLFLREPYWSAWMKYGWLEGTEGLSISMEAVEEAEKRGKKLLIEVHRYGSYEITTNKARKYGATFTARDNKPLLCIPKNVCKKLPEVITEQVKTTFDTSKLREAMKRNGVKL